MSNSKNIMIVGVGGQGTLLASRLIGDVMIANGFDVKVSEVHGMSQRGGSVVTYVRYGTAVASPVIEIGEADIILAFEKSEAAKYLPYLKKDGIIIVNTQQIDPMPVVIGAATYPTDIINEMQNLGVNVVAFDALSLAESAGSVKAVNTVMIGAMARGMGMEKEPWLNSIVAVVPARFLELNKQAFELGYANS